MKKITKIVLILLITCVYLTGCGRVTSYQEISFQTYSKMIEKKESFPLFIGAASCSACATFKITLNKVVEKYQVDFYYIDVDKLSDTEVTSLRKQVNYTYTPTTTFIKKGVEESVTDRLDENWSYNKLVAKLTKEGYIK